MARKCDTQKYRRRRIREREAHAKSVARRQRERHDYWARARAEEERRRQEWLADPRRQQIQQLVNVLAARLYTFPTYRILAMYGAISDSYRG